MPEWVKPAKTTAAAALAWRFALAVAVGAPAFAGEANDDPPEQDPSTLPAVTVTAEKTDRSIRNTATSVAVFDSTDLERDPALLGSRDVFANVANVTSSGTGNFAPTIRGIGGTGAAQGVDAFFAGARQRLGVTIDGRPASFNEVVYGGASLWDVEQVEVLRGPQSTLQGRNAIAGTMAIKTRDPDFTPDFSARVVGGNFDNRQGAFYATAPIGDGQELAWRVSGDYQSHETFVRGFEPYAGAGDPGDFEAKTLRAKLLYQPAALSDFTTLLSVDHVATRGPQTENVLEPYSAHVAVTPFQPVMAPATTSVTADSKFGLNDRFGLENLLTGTDVDFHRDALPGQGIAQIDAREWSWEPRLRINKTSASAWSGVFGAYLYRANQDESLDVPGDEKFLDAIRTNAVFGEGVVGLRDNLDLTLGARYERETHRRNGGDERAVAIAIDETYDAFLPKAGLALHASDATTLGVDVGRGYNSGGGGVTFGVPIVSYSYGAEYVWNYEAYFRSEFDDRRLQLNGNVFYSDYKDMQLPFDLSQDPSTYSVVIRNAPQAITYGAEFGVRYLLRPGLELHADLGLLDTKVTRYANSGVQGHELPSAPDATSDIGVRYTSAGGLELSASARYSDGYFSTIQNLPVERVNPDWLANAQAAYRFNGHFKLFGYVTNLFDETVPLLIGATTEAAAAVATPRTVGVGVQVWM